MFIIKQNQFTSNRSADSPKKKGFVIRGVNLRRPKGSVRVRHENAIAFASRTTKGMIVLNNRGKQKRYHLGTVKIISH